MPPDYRQCVTISTKAAQNELLSLAVLAIIPPILVGLLLGAEALGGFLAGLIVSGQLLAVLHGERRRRLGQRQEGHRGRTA